jgi:hypothetical protein
MKYFLVVVVLALLGVASCRAAEPNWNPTEATKEAEHDIRTGHIKFYWSGTIAVGPVGVPLDLARHYPRANAGIGCTTTDVAFRERQEEYARRYNQRILAYLRRR